MLMDKGAIMIPVLSSRYVKWSESVKAKDEKD